MGRLPLIQGFMDSLQIELEGPELQARGGRAVASAEDLHAYLEKIMSLERDSKSSDQ